MVMIRVRGGVSDRSSMLEQFGMDVPQNGGFTCCGNSNECKIMLDFILEMFSKFPLSSTGLIDHLKA